MTSYYKRNKEAIKAGIKYKADLRTIKIHSSILDYRKNFFKLSLTSRRSLLHNLLIGEFNLSLPYLNNSYEDFVKIYNDLFEIEEETIFINCEDYKPKPYKEDFYFEEVEQETDSTDYIIQSDESEDRADAERVERLRNLREITRF